MSEPERLGEVLRRVMVDLVKPESQAADAGDRLRPQAAAKRARPAAAALGREDTQPGGKGPQRGRSERAAGELANEGRSEAVVVNVSVSSQSGFWWIEQEGPWQGVQS